MKKLIRGDEVLLISTARKVRPEEIEPCIQILSSWGLKVILGKYVFAEDRQFAGTDCQRSEDLQWALNHPTAKAILCTRGGYGTSRLIDLLDFSIFQQNPKWLIGFSDITILHQHINQLGFPSIHGTMALLFENKIAIESLQRALFEENYQLPLPAKLSGEVVGGNLTLLVHGLGTPSEIDTDGKLLFIEEIDEYLYHIDRMLLQLKRAGKLAKLKALLVGGFTKMNDNNIPFGKTINEIVLDHTAVYKYPVYFDIPAGHIDENQAIIFGEAS